MRFNVSIRVKLLAAPAVVMALCIVPALMAVNTLNSIEGKLSVVGLLVVATILTFVITQYVAHDITSRCRAVLGQMRLLAERVDVLTHCFEGLAEKDLTRSYDANLPLLRPLGDGRGAQRDPRLSEDDGRCL